MGKLLSNCVKCKLQSQFIKMQVSSTQDGQIYHKLPSDQYNQRVKGIFFILRDRVKIDVGLVSWDIVQVIGAERRLWGATGECVYLCISVSLFGQSDVVYLHMHRHFKCDTSQAGLDISLSWFA